MKILILILIIALHGALSQVVQVGTTGNDYIYGVATDSTNAVLVGGQTDGSFPSYTLQGTHDAFLLKYTSTGSLAWAKQFSSGQGASSCIIHGNNALLQE